MYEVGDWVYDESKPEFMFFVPCISGNFWMVDCWIVDADGNVHPDYSTAGVPVATRSFVAVDNGPMFHNVTNVQNQGMFTLHHAVPPSLLARG